MGFLGFQQIVDLFNQFVQLRRVLLRRAPIYFCAVGKTPISLSTRSASWLGIVGFPSSFRSGSTARRSLIFPNSCTHCTATVLDGPPSLPAPWFESVPAQRPGPSTSREPSPLRSASQTASACLGLRSLATPRSRQYSACPAPALPGSSISQLFPAARLPTRLPNSPALPLRCTAHPRFRP